MISRYQFNIENGLKIHSEGKAMEMEWNEMLLLQSTTAMFDGRLRWEEIQPEVPSNMYPFRITCFSFLVFCVSCFLFCFLIFFFQPCRGSEVLLSFDPESFPTFFCFSWFFKPQKVEKLPDDFILLSFCWILFLVSSSWELVGYVHQD